MHAALHRVILVAASVAMLAAQPNPGSIVSHVSPAGVQTASIFDTAGYLYSTGFSGPVTPGAAQTARGGGTCREPAPPVGEVPVPCTDAYISKVDPSGNLIFGTLLGGSLADTGTALAVDSIGDVFLVGTTQGAFPTTANAAIGSSATSRAFAAKLSADGSQFVYATYLPSFATRAWAVAVDADGHAYVAGDTTSGHAFIIKISADGSSFDYTATLAGSNVESARALAIDPRGNAIVAGETSSPDFPVSAGAVQSSLAGSQNAFAAKLDGAGNIVFSTFLGGSGSDAADALQIDSFGNLYIAGSTTSLDFPTTPGSFESAPLVPLWNDSPGGFIAKLSPEAGSIQYATYLPAFYQVNLALDPSGNAYVTGPTRGAFPITRSAPVPCSGGNLEAFVARLDSQGGVRDATYFNNPGAGTIRAGADGSVLILGGASMARIRFGDPGWIAPPCMTPDVVNSATLTSNGFVTPGELVTLSGFEIGPHDGIGSTPDALGNTPTILAGVQVFFDGKPAPIFYAQSRQVNAQAPFELSGQGSTAVTIQYNGATFGPVNMRINTATPGFFRLQPDASAQAYAVNQDGTINGLANPAARGSVVALWGTGFGSTDPPCPTGGLNFPEAVKLAPSQMLTIPPGIPVTYAGSAPTLACGIVQVNIQIPSDAASGPLHISPLANGATGGDTIIYIR